jgi:hypothetical protein
VPQFGCVFAAARAHVNLSVLAWMIDAMRTGNGHAVFRPKLREAVAQLIAYFET